MRKIFGFIFLVIFVLTVQNTQAQTPTATPTAPKSGIRAGNADGEVTTISQTDNKISMLTGDGAIDVIITPTTGFKKVAPDNPSIATATAITFAEIGEKDKILVTGVVSADKKTLTAKNVYLMSKSDIAKRNQAERELWRTRGISGKVVLVDFKTQNVTIATPSRGMMPAGSVVLSPKDNAQYLRYAADSVKYADAVGSSLAEIKVGDELRALGDKGTDGLTFKAEKYLSGSFKMIAGKITAVDVAKNEITIEDSATKKPVIVVVKDTTLMKKFPAEMAQMMAAMSGGGRGQGQGQGQGGGQGGTTMVMTRPSGTTPPTGTTPSTGTTPAQGGQPQGMRQGRGGEFDDMVNNLPSLKLADLKIGDTIGISSTAGNTPNRYTAIKLLSGVEAFLNMPQIPSIGGRPSQQPTINIPGLDGGIGF